METCACSDPMCPHHGMLQCEQEATACVFRVDMEDETGTPMCEACADDAAQSGLFRVEDLA